MIIGYTTGVFDMFHIGHLNILKRAKEQCDYLIVGVSTDDLVEHDKNKTPIIPFENRCAIVEAIRYVDKVVPQKDKNKFGAWEKYQFNKMFVGSDWEGTPQWNAFEKQLAPHGVEIVYLPHTDGISSTILRETLGLSKTGGGRNDISIGYTTGVYDMFHIGHLNIIRRSKQECDYLIVGVSTDECVEGYKHHTPVVPYAERAAIVAAIKYVDEVVPQTTMDKTEYLKHRHFDVMFHGDEWKGTELYNNYEKEFAKYGARIEYLSHTEGISSSMLRGIISK